MQEVFELILLGIQSGYDMLKGFSISAWGFSFSLWDFLLALFVLSFIVPIVVAPDHSGSFFNISRWFTSNSERNDREKFYTERSNYYSDQRNFYSKQREYYQAKINRYRDLAKRK